MLDSQEITELHATRFAAEITAILASIAAISISFAYLSNTVAILVFLLSVMLQSLFTARRYMSKIEADALYRRIWLDTLTDREALKLIIQNSRDGRDTHQGVYEEASRLSTEDIAQFLRREKFKSGASVWVTALEPATSLAIQLIAGLGISHLLH